MNSRLDPTAKAGAPANPGSATHAINALGLDLLAKGTAAHANALLSPYSIQSALAMVFAGAEGDTRAEMACVLHFPAEEADLHQGFAALQEALENLRRTTTESAQQAERWGIHSEPVVLTVANRLFGQQGYDFRETFLSVLKDSYGAPFQALDFVHDSLGATRAINGWVEERTGNRIRGLIPPGVLDQLTRLVLVNAIHLKAPWDTPFPQHATEPAPFHLNDGSAVNVPTMKVRSQFGYARGDGFTVVTIPYTGGELQCLILLPDQRNGLGSLEAMLTPDLLGLCATPKANDLILHLPKFRLEPPLFQLGSFLQTMGMWSAFDKPRGSANFDRMAPRRLKDYLLLSEVIHKTFLNLDEKGTEAAAATAVAVAGAGVVREPPRPIEVRVDHPFLFAVQHRRSGACLFLGRMTDPR